MRQTRAWLVVAGSMVMAGTTIAATITDLPTAPTVRPGSGDIVQTQSDGTAYWWTYNYASDTHAGQTFTTGTAAGGYNLDSVGVLLVDTANSGLTFTLKVYGGFNTQYDGSHVTLPPLVSESATASSLTDNNWLVFSLTTPLHVDPNTQYAYTLTCSSGWAGPGLKKSDVYGGGFAIVDQFGWMDGTGGNGYLQGQGVAADAAFSVGLQAVPEPTSIGVLVGTAAILLGGRRSRRA